MASSSASHPGQVVCTQRLVDAAGAVVGSLGPAAHGATSSNSGRARPLQAARPTRSWLSWVVIMRQPSFSSPTRFATGTRTSS